MEESSNAMSSPTPAPGESESARTASSGDGPAANEDLTIAEQLDLMRVSDQSRLGEQCFLLPNGEKRWIAESAVLRFVARHGAEHSSDYLANHGANWEETFFRTL